MLDIPVKWAGSEGWMAYPDVADTKISPSETTARLKLIGPSLTVCELIFRLLCMVAMAGASWILSRVERPLESVAYATTRGND
jgi:hypothetical protein